jgi:hypothetical protein
MMRLPSVDVASAQQDYPAERSTSEFRDRQQGVSDLFFFYLVGIK